MANALYVPVFKPTGPDGLPLPFGKLYTYAAGTSTNKATYTDATMSTPNTNPVILDAEGSAQIWTSGFYKLNLKDANDVQQDDWPVDQWTNDSGTAGPAGTFAMATAGGTADAITANYTPDVTLSNNVTVGFVAGFDNATTTPTFAPDGLTAHTITKNGGAALVAGDIKALGTYYLTYNSANTRWELANPTTAIIPAASIALTKLAAQTGNSVVAEVTGSSASPTAVAMGASTILARLAAGNIKAASVAEILTLTGALTVTASSLGANGYITLSNTLKLQWGVTAQSVSATKPVTFPSAFSSAVYSIIITEGATNAGAQAADWVGSITTSGFTINDQSGDNMLFYWIAIGV